MRPKSLMLLVLALGCGLVASLGITQVISKRDGGKSAPAAETEAILVVVEDVPLGTPLSSDVLKLEQWPKDKIPDGAMADIKELEGRRALTSLYKGEPILKFKLGTIDGGPDDLIPTGYRVVAVKVNSQSGVGGLILPGTRVDVLVHLGSQGRERGQLARTQTILEDIKVFAVNDEFSTQAGSDKQRSIVAKTVSLLVKPDQAEKVTLASELGKIRLVLRSPDDDQQTSPRGTSVRDLLSDSDGADRDEESLLENPQQPEKQPGLLDFLAKAASSAPAPEKACVEVEEKLNTHVVRLLRGAEVEVVVLESDDADSPAGLGLWKQRSYDMGPSPRTRPLAPDLVPPNAEPAEKAAEEEKVEEKEEEHVVSE